MRPGAWISGALLLAAGLAGGWTLHDLFGGATSDDPPESPAAATAVAVTTEEVRLGDLPVVVTALGMVEAPPSASLALTSRAGGRVTEVRVVPGQRVAKGDLVVSFDPRPFDAIVEQARAEAARATAELDAFDRGGRDTERRKLELELSRAKTKAALASAQEARLVPLLKDKLVSERSVDEAKREAAQRHIEVAVAQHALDTFRSTGADLEHAQLIAAKDAAKARLEDAEAVRAETEVTAPAAGVVTEVAVGVGQRTEPRDLLARVLIGDARRVRFELRPEDSARVAVGAKVTWSGVTGDDRTGAVESIDPAVDAVSGLVSVFVRPADNGPPPPPGRAVRGQLEVQRLTTALLVPLPALVRVDDKPAVVVAGGDGVGHVVPVRVRVRSADRGVAAVEGKLTAGDQVIVEGAYNLPDGAHVVPRPASAHRSGH